MKGSWTLAIILWGGIIVALVVGLILDARTSPEQRKKDVQRRKESWKKNREAEKRRFREKREQRPEKGCLQSTLEVWFACLFLFVVVIIGVMVIIS